MSRVKRLCVYCGSSGGVADAYRDAARRTGVVLAKAGIEVIYGGGRVGLMGLLADAAIAAGGRVTGIIPDFLHTREIAHPSVSELIVVGSMHERKQRMFKLADAFAVLPGGIGTLEEALECLTWRQLGLHDQPIMLVDIESYWAPLIALIERVVEAGFARPDTHELFRIVPGPEALIDALAAEPEPRLSPATRRV